MQGGEGKRQHKQARKKHGYNKAHLNNKKKWFANVIKREINLSQSHFVDKKTPLGTFKEPVDV